jgi:hypothetical protein
MTIYAMAMQILVTANRKQLGVTILHRAAICADLTNEAFVKAEEVTKPTSPSGYVIR